MKKTLLIPVFGLFAVGAFGQSQDVADKAMVDASKKEKETSDKAILDEKKKSKAQTWLDRGKIYEGIGRRYVQIDSSASLEAYNSFKKAIELDAAKPSKVTKDAQKYLSGGGVDEGVDLKSSLLNNGAQKFQLKKYEEAVKYFKLVEEVSPKDTLAPLYGGYGALQGQSELNGKLAKLEAAATKDEAMIADLKAKAKMFGNVAAEQMEMYLTNGGKDPGNFQLLAQLYRQEKMADKAIVVLEKGMVAVPAQRNAFKAERVNALLESGKTDEALAGLTELSTLEPSNAQYSLNTGILHDNAASGFSAEIRKLKDAPKKMTNAERHLKESEETDKVFVDEMKRLTDGIKKQPKNAELKRQKLETEGRQKENKKTIDENKAEVAATKAELDKIGGVEAINKKITELTAKQLERKSLAKSAYLNALKADGNNYDALFNMGVYYYNEAAELKSSVDAMDMKDYNEKGKAVEAKVCGKFKQALPFFTKAKTVKEEEAVADNIKTIDGILKEYENKKIVCEEAK
jgi:tetratricopeptide (TPR) repeat protein